MHFQVVIPTLLPLAFLFYLLSPSLLFLHFSLPYGTYWRGRKTWGILHGAPFRDATLCCPHLSPSQHTWWLRVGLVGSLNSFHPSHTVPVLPTVPACAPESKPSSGLTTPLPDQFPVLLPLLSVFFSSSSPLYPPLNSSLSEWRPPWTSLDENHSVWHRYSDHHLSLPAIALPNTLLPIANKHTPL